MAFSRRLAFACGRRGSTPTSLGCSTSQGAGGAHPLQGIKTPVYDLRLDACGRRNGKPTSLGCFDHEEQAARAYDKMMLWCELHNTSGVKGGITNFDPTEYEKDLHQLSSVTQARNKTFSLLSCGIG